MSRLELGNGIKERNCEVNTENQIELSFSEIKELDFGLVIPRYACGEPTVFTRSALFGVRKSQGRVVVDKVVLASRKDIKITYTGVLLNVLDEDAYLACLVACAPFNLGTKVYITLSWLARITGKSAGKQIYVNFKERLDRLSTACITVDTKDVHCTTGLLKWGYDSFDRRLWVRIDPDGAVLLNALTYMDWSTRFEIKSRTAKRLYSYVASHSPGKQSISLSSLQSWMGHDGRLRDFKRWIRAALNELTTLKVIHDPKISWDVISWTRPKVESKKQ